MLKLQEHYYETFYGMQSSLIHLMTEYVAFESAVDAGLYSFGCEDKDVASHSAFIAKSTAECRALYRRLSGQVDAIQQAVKDIVSNDRRLIPLLNKLSADKERNRQIVSDDMNI